MTLETLVGLFLRKLDGSTPMFFLKLLTNGMSKMLTWTSLFARLFTTLLLPSNDVMNLTLSSLSDSDRLFKEPSYSVLIDCLSSSSISLKGPSGLKLSRLSVNPFTLNDFFLLGLYLDSYWPELARGLLRFESLFSNFSCVF